MRRRGGGCTAFQSHESQDEESHTPCSAPTTLPPECGPLHEIRPDTHSSDNRIERLKYPQPERMFLRSPG